jgi:hypothetical protein
MSYSSSVNSEIIKKRELDEMLPGSSELCIESYEDQYLQTTFLLVKDELIVIEGHPTISKQDYVRGEFERIYFDTFYKLFSQFNFFADYISKVADFHKYIQENGDHDAKHTWEKVFLEGKSLFFTLKNDSQVRNKFRTQLDQIEKKFNKQNFQENFEVYALGEALEQISFSELFLSFRTLAFQIGYSMAFYEYCKLLHGCNFSTVEKETLNSYCDEFVEKVNKISNSEWANCFKFLRDLQGEFHPKFFPVITHLILRKIQGEGEFFDGPDNFKYMAPECFYFHEKAVAEIKKQMGEHFSALQIRTHGLEWILVQEIAGENCGILFDRIILEKKNFTNFIFREHLKIETSYLNEIELYSNLRKEIYKNIIKQ